jgi:hypothetical protein
MVAEMSPWGKGSQISMRIDNTDQFPLAVEIVPLKLSMDIHGKETLTPADNDLLVIPETASILLMIPVTVVIEPGSSQSVVVRYLGEPTITRSQAYRISIRQVKIKQVSENVPDLGLLVQFDTLLNVRPKNTMPNLRVKHITQSQDGLWNVEVANTGKSYGRLSKTAWHVSDGHRSVYLDRNKLTKRLMGSFIMPESRRIFRMEPLKGFDVNSVSIDIDNVN